MSQALYRKYRSRTLTEVVGQEHITDILTRAIATDKVSHAYLLTGPRGVGKTSIARILAHDINNLPYDDDKNHLDIIEIDAASNNGVEDVRDLREKARIAPSSARKKIYIIDEVHMLSKAAFNALLKTLEEPPEHVVFILATTDFDKLPDTIISRTQVYNFRAISQSKVTAHLATIAKKEGIKIEPAALELIAEHGGGAFRDSIGLLDQLQNLTDKNETITKQMVETLLGLPAGELLETLLDGYARKDLALIAKTLQTSQQNGVSAPILAEQLAHKIRDNIVEKPEFLPLLDRLLEVAKSSRPDLKLLIVLSEKIIVKPKSAPLLTQTAPDLVELETAATADDPALKMKQQTPLKMVASAQKTPEPPKPASKLPSEKASQTDMPEATPTPVATAKPSVTSGDFDWPAIIAATKEQFVAVYSVINKCDAEFDGQKITIFVRNKFNKTKLDDPKHRVNLTKILANFGLENADIDTVPNVRPPKNAKAAEIAAMMGGGEEISLD